MSVKKYSKMRKQIKLCRHSSLEQLLYMTVSWSNFSTIGSQVTDLKLKMHAQLGLIFISTKQRKYNFCGI